MVEWSKDLYTNPHVFKSNVLANGMIESASQSDLNASMVDLNLNNEEDDPSQYEKVSLVSFLQKKRKPPKNPKILEKYYQLLSPSKSTVRPSARPVFGMFSGQITI